MSAAERCACLAADASHFNPVLFGEDCTPERLRKHFHSFLALLRAERNFRPESYFGRVVYFLAEEEAASDGEFPYLSRWREVAKGPLELASAPGQSYHDDV
jgi:hypothetical protein